MRVASLLAAVCLAVVFSGCASYTTPHMPIVGDSMSVWNGNGGGCSSAVGAPCACGTGTCSSCATNCGTSSNACQCGDAECAGGCVAAPMPQMMNMFGAGGLMGCGGNTCCGQCGGQCGVARAHAYMQQLHANAMQNPHLAKMHDRAFRRCAYGTCGARQGPQQGMAAFPYYTVRGPRDFLAPNPPSIGP